VRSSGGARFRVTPNLLPQLGGRSEAGIRCPASGFDGTMDQTESVRLDVWLDVACVFKTRSQAQQACRRGRVRVNGDRGKPHRAVRPGDEIRIARTGARDRVLEVVALADAHVARAVARELYVDHTPPPTPEEIELRRLQKLAAPPTRPKGTGAPKKKDRRALRRAKQWPLDD
jgi:ribosome-associated heat shock protein Hsp15